MKRGSRLTRKQKEIAHSWGLNPMEWMLAEEKMFKYILVNKTTGALKAIDKKKKTI